MRFGPELTRRYDGLKVVAKGGMADIVEGHNKLGQRVAIKLLRAGYASDPEINARFRREARTVSQLKSPHIVRIFDFDAPAGSRPFIVMEYLTGHDLAKEIALKGSFPLEEAATWMAQACHAIEEAHAAGIVHRDLKPSNLFLAEDGDKRILKVLDFGIAKQEKAATDDPVTLTSVLFGSPFYMSPETFRGAKEADVRSDVWSLGVIFYEMLTGAVPFLRETALAVGLAVAKEPHVPPTQRVPTLPRSADVVIARALKKDPNERYQSVRELLAAIEVYLPKGRNETMMIPMVVDKSDDDQRTIRKYDVVTELGMVALRPGETPDSSRLSLPDDGDAPTRIRTDEDPATFLAGIQSPTQLVDTGTGRVAGPVAISQLPVQPAKRVNPLMIAVPAAALVFGLGGWLIGRSPSTEGTASNASQPVATTSPEPPPAAKTAESVPTPATATAASAAPTATAAPTAAASSSAEAVDLDPVPAKPGTTPRTPGKLPGKKTDKKSGKFTPSKI
ncbi:MAG: serine/threonine protein kinase [Polyangiaceae bacterium]|nr:serine/threonine protein kinase [Polyangiaceae bacterium]